MPVRIKGAYFNAATSVTFDGDPATNVVVVNDATIECDPPAGAGTVQLRVFTEHGFGQINYTYPSTGPVVTNVSPSSGTQEGGRPITITGTGFVSGAIVTIDGNACTSVVFVNSTTITAVTPSGTSGAKTVRVTNPDTSFDELASGYTYIWSPVALTLTGWWRASYTGGTWGGSAAGRDLSVAGGTPSAGSAVNGFTPAVVDGIDDYFTNATAISTLLSASDYFVWVLAKVNSIGTAFAATGVYQNDALVCDSGGFFGIHLSTSGGNKVQFFHWDGGPQAAEVAISLGQFALFLMRYDSANIRGRVDNGPVATDAAGNISGTAGTLVAGRNNSGAYADVEILEIGMKTGAESDARFDDIRAYVNDRYGLAL